jgi:hypothetical protein
VLSFSHPDLRGIVWVRSPLHQPHRLAAFNAAGAVVQWRLQAVDAFESFINQAFPLK